MKRYFSIKIPLAFMISLLFAGSSFAQKNPAGGTISGVVIDEETHSPLIGAEIAIVNSVLGAATDMDGAFVITDVPAGSYNLRFTYIGYETLTKTDIIVRPKRTTRVDARLKLSPLQSQEVVVNGGYFNQNSEQPASSTTFSYEEVRRAPGSAGDVSRILLGLPSLAKVNDQSNSLIVRGGNPMENAFFVDNIEIPNINHFPMQGTSGGPIGMINVDFIRDVSFHTGGFSAAYGDKLSSIMNISFREGNRDAYNSQLDLDFSGFGGVFEGPLFSNKGSFLLSARRSYLDFLINSIDIGTSVAPVYGDVQAKIVYDISPQHKLTFLSIFGDDHNNPDQKAAEENDMTAYGNQDIYEYTGGFNWRAVWKKSGYSNTSIAYTADNFREDMYETGSGIHLLKNRSLQRSVKFRNFNHFRLNPGHSVEFGVEVKELLNHYNNYYGEFTDALGDTVPGSPLRKNLRATKFGAFFNYIVQPAAPLTATVGIRADYFSYDKRHTLAPRFSLAWRVTDRTTLSGSTGLYYQNLPLLLLAQNPQNKNLKAPWAVHYILGISHLLTANTRLSLELYEKDYRNFPVDPTQPSLFLIDETFYRNSSFYFNHQPLTDNGRAYSRGVEIMLQKKLAEVIYGLASASWFRTRYRGGDGIWRDRVFDNRIVFSIEGGYKPNNRWEFSTRWIYAGGVPYTPFDDEVSRQLNRGILDESRINADRYPDYHSLNVRFDRRFLFSGSNLVFYFSVWNAYSRKNVATYFWNQKENQQDTIYQWTLLPIFGLEYEF